MLFKEISPSFDSPFLSRYGHKAVSVDDNTVLIFGGGNQGYIEDVTLFNTEENSIQNLPVVVSGNNQNDAFRGLAAFDMTWMAENKTVLIFGGLMEKQRFSNDLYRLENYCCLLLCDTTGNKPSRRIGHTFTTVRSNLIVMFGGIEDTNEDGSRLEPKFSNDTYLLHTNANNTSSYIWEKIIDDDAGQNRPSPRESHSAVLHGNVLVIFGGANGCKRLSDLWFFDIKFYTWTLVETTGGHPLGRSLHSAVIADDTMYVFGGFIRSENTSRSLWKCTNSMQSFNLLTCKWGTKSSRVKPEPRAGHAALEVGGRIYIFSGRMDASVTKSFQCLHDIWCVDIKKPSRVREVELEHADMCSLKIQWTRTMSTVCYLVEIRERSEIEMSNVVAAAANQAAAKPALTEVNGSRVVVRKKKTETEEMNSNSSSNTGPKIIIHECKIVNFPLIFEQLDGAVEGHDDDESTDSEVETGRMRGCWCIVGIFKENHCTIKSYLAYTINRANLTSENIPNLLGIKHIPLVPDRVYFIRVSAINCCGTSRFSSIVGFKTNKIDNDDDSNEKSNIIFDIQIECHIYFYLITWRSALTNVEFLVILEEQLKYGINTIILYKGRELMCRFSSSLLRQTNDNFIIRIKVLSHEGRGLHEARVLYKDGLLTEMSNKTCT